jgi:23S rRNA pseudouridine2605 synthase
MIRLQKLLANAGLGSRRRIEEWIRAGRVTVGGRVAELGCRACVSDDIRLDGQPVVLAPAVTHQALLYHKPVGEMTTRADPAGRPTVFERLPPCEGGRWINVGRLDVNTQGLLLFTSDGELAHRLMHPSSQVEREYLVRVRGAPPDEVIRTLLSGVQLEDGQACFDRITLQPGEGRGHSSYRVVLHEGRNREVRRLWSAVGYEVSRLLRIRYGPISLPRELRPGQARLASPQELASLTADGIGQDPHP